MDNKDKTNNFAFSTLGSWAETESNSTKQDYGTTLRPLIEIDSVRTAPTPVNELQTYGSFSAQDAHMLNVYFDFGDADIIQQLQNFTEKYNIEGDENKVNRSICALIEGATQLSSKQIPRNTVLKQKSTQLKDGKQSNGAASYAVVNYTIDDRATTNVPCIIKLPRKFNRSDVQTYTKRLSNWKVGNQPIKNADKKTCNAMIFVETRHIIIDGKRIFPESVKVVTKWLTVTENNLHLFNKAYGDTTDKASKLEGGGIYSGVVSIAIKGLSKYNKVGIVGAKSLIDTMLVQHVGAETCKYDPLQHGFTGDSWTLGFDPKAITIIGTLSTIPAYARGSGVRANESDTSVLNKDEMAAAFEAFKLDNASTKLPINKSANNKSSNNKNR